jgi:alpha-mannosidase
MRARVLQRCTEGKRLSHPWQARAAALACRLLCHATKALCLLGNALCPHAGTLNDSSVKADAYALNNPAVCVKASGKTSTVPTDYSLLRASADNVVCDTVKPAESGEGTVLRVFEYDNRRTHVHLSTDLPATRVYLCDMLEREIAEIPFKDGTFEYTFSGFEIATFKLV